MARGRSRPKPYDDWRLSPQERRAHLELAANKYKDSKSCCQITLAVLLIGGIGGICAALSLQASGYIVLPYNETVQYNRTLENGTVEHYSVIELQPGTREGLFYGLVLPGGIGLFVSMCFACAVCEGQSVTRRLDRLKRTGELMDGPGYSSHGAVAPYPGPPGYPPPPHNPGYPPPGSYGYRY